MRTEWFERQGRQKTVKQACTSEAWRVTSGTSKSPSRKQAIAKEQLQTFLCMTTMK
jgi:hypothetical protein